VSCCANVQVVKTTLEKGRVAGYQKEAQVCVMFKREFVNVFFNSVVHNVNLRVCMKCITYIFVAMFLTMRDMARCMQALYVCLSVTLMNCV